MRLYSGSWQPAGLSTDPVRPGPSTAVRADAPNPARHREDRIAAIMGLDGVTWVAFGLTVVGWSMVWASGLFRIAMVPVWLAAVVFFTGLALIPLRRVALP